MGLPSNKQLTEASVVSSTHYLTDRGLAMPDLSGKDGCGIDTVRFNLPAYKPIFQSGDDFHGPFSDGNPSAMFSNPVAVAPITRRFGSSLRVSEMALKMANREDVLIGAIQQISHHIAQRTEACVKHLADIWYESNPGQFHAEFFTVQGSNVGMQIVSDGEPILTIVKETRSGSTEHNGMRREYVFESAFKLGYMVHRGDYPISSTVWREVETRWEDFATTERKRHDKLRGFIMRPENMYSHPDAMKGMFPVLLSKDFFSEGFRDRKHNENLLEYLTELFADEEGKKQA